MIVEGADLVVFNVTPSQKTEVAAFLANDKHEVPDTQFRELIDDKRNDRLSSHWDQWLRLGIGQRS